MFPIKYRVLFVLLLLSGLAFAGPLSQEFNFRIRQTTNETEARAVVAEYKNSMSELTDLRALQNYWMELDMAECQAFFYTRHQTRPTDPEAHYLWARTLLEAEEQILQGRALITQYPDFYWGYRSLSGAYTNSYFATGSDEELKARLEPNVASDMALLEQGLQKFPNDDYVHVTLMSYHLSQRAYPAAESFALRITDPAAIRANFSKVERLVIESRRLHAFEQLFPKLISNMILQGELPAADSLQMYQYYYLSMMKDTANWQMLDSYINASPEILQNPRFSDLIIQIHIAREEFDAAMDLISQRIISGDLRQKDLEEAGGYARLRSLDGWSDLLELARLMREERLPRIRESALANRLNRPAPAWSFPDLEGNMHSLADYSGKILILNFWAAWCAPCKASMPILSDWAQNKPDNVEIVSINVWERDIPAARQFVRNSEFAMTFLEGDRQIPTDYGFSGIPYICVIDAEGNLAWELSGYSEDLEDILGFWTSEINKTGDR